MSPATLIVLVMGVFFLFSFVNQVIRQAQLEQLREEVRADVARLKTENTMLQHNVEYIESNDYAEQIAREQLGYAREGDTVLMPTYPRSSSKHDHHYGIDYDTRIRHSYCPPRPDNCDDRTQLDALVAYATWQHSMNKPAISVVIVNWNGRHLLGRCLTDLHVAIQPYDQVIVVDNGSHDGSVDWLHTRIPLGHDNRTADKSWICRRQQRCTRRLSPRLDITHQ
jgi:cell division protein FtsB